MTIGVVAACGKELKPRATASAGAAGTVYPSIVETIQMNNAIRFPVIAAAGLALTACATDGYDSGSGSSGLRDASTAAEVACTTAVNANYGGNVKSISVTSSEFSQANSMVMIKAGGVRGGTSTETWKCLVSNDGTVEELTVVGQ